MSNKTIKTRVSGETLSVLLTGHHTTPLVTRCSLFTSVTGRHAMPLVTGDLSQVLRIWGSIFYLQTFFTLHSFLHFHGFPGTGSSTSKSPVLHTAVWNSVPWITQQSTNIIFSDKLYLNMTNILINWVIFIENILINLSHCSDFKNLLKVYFSFM